MVAEDDEPPAELRLGGGDAGVHFLVGQTEVSLGQRLALGDVFLLVLREHGNQKWLSSLACETFRNARDTKKPSSV